MFMKIKKNYIVYKILNPISIVCKKNSKYYVTTCIDNEPI